MQTTKGLFGQVLFINIQTFASSVRLWDPWEQWLWFGHQNTFLSRTWKVGIWEGKKLQNYVSYKWTNNRSLATIISELRKKPKLTHHVNNFKWSCPSFKRINRKINEKCDLKSSITALSPRLLGTENSCGEMWLNQEVLLWFFNKQLAHSIY